MRQSVQNPIAPTRAKVPPKWLRRFAAAAALVLLPIRAQAFEDQYLVIKTAKTITISGEEIENAVIVIKDGKIDAVGKKVDYPSDSKIIDASRLTVMPGLINAHFSLEAAPGRRGGIGRGGPGAKRVADAFYPPDDRTFEKLLAAGFTTVALQPEGTGVAGHALVLHTYDLKPKTGLKTDGLLRITFDNTSRDKRALADALKAAKEQIEKENQPASRPAPETGPARPGPTSQPTTGPMSRPAPSTQPATRPTTQPAPRPPAPPNPLVSLLKKQDGYLAQIEFARASDALHFADAISKYDFPRVYLFAESAIDAYQVVDHDLFGKAKALVVLTPTLANMPLTVNPYNRVRRFLDAGCDVAVVPLTDDVSEHEKLRERVTLLLRSGLSRKDALKALTHNAARAIAMDKELGSIEKGKRADLIFLDGDPLDPFAKVRRVMIDGVMVRDLDARRTARP